MNLVFPQLVGPFLTYCAPEKNSSGSKFPISSDRKYGSIMVSTVAARQHN